jgi:cytochrome c6
MTLTCKNLWRFSMMAAMVITAVLWTNSAFAAAADTYKSKCAMCHGADGKGDTPVGKKFGTHDFASAEVQGSSDAQLEEIVAKGKNKMPAYEKSLSAAEIKDLVAYVRELGKKK